MGSISIEFNNDVVHNNAVSFQNGYFLNYAFHFYRLIHTFIMHMNASAVSYNIQLSSYLFLWLLQQCWVQCKDIHMQVFTKYNLRCSHGSFNSNNHSKNVTNRHCIFNTWKPPCPTEQVTYCIVFKNKYNAIYTENVSLYATSSNTETLLYKTIIMHFIWSLFWCRIV